MVSRAWFQDWEHFERILLEAASMLGMPEDSGIQPPDETPNWRAETLRHHRRLRSLESSLAVPVGKMVSRFASSGRVSRMPDSDAKELLRLRIDAALRLLQFLNGKAWDGQGWEGPTFPPGPDEPILLWLVDDWWIHSGRDLWLAWLSEMERGGI